jgi:hypothetical protein
VVTEKDLLEFLQQVKVEDDPAGALTVGEIAERTGHCDNWVRRKVSPLVKSGQVEVVPKRIKRMDGVVMRGHAYRVVNN